MASADLLFELFTEEIPASYQRGAIEQWRRRADGLFKDALLEYKEIEIGGSPRRLYAYVRSLADRQTSASEELKGPPRKICFDDKGKPTPALAGFAKKASTEPDKVGFKKFGDAEYAFAEVKLGGAKIADVLPAIFEELIFSTRFPRTMRWGESDTVYARPIIQYYLQYGEKMLTLPDGALAAIPRGRAIHGHFSFHAKPFKLDKAADYFSLLKKQGILVKNDERRQKIEDMLQAAASKMGHTAIIPDSLLDEVCFLVEIPKVHAGAFPTDYLDLPENVILSEMEEHQRYFGLRQKSGKLAANFLIVANSQQADAATKKNIIIGNERVLNARLSDGSFFFHEDRKKPLFDHAQRLKKVVFQEGMGSMFDKKERLKKIAHILLAQSNIQVKIPAEQIERACDLAKADLTTALVYEFDNLQGEIGVVYARLDGEEEELCQAILEHYQPRNQADDYPKSQLGILLSLSEKLDNIFAGFILDKKPTASTDPFGLRRQALYLIEILIENKIHLNFESMMAQMWALYPGAGSNEKSVLALSEEVWEFVRGRLSTIFEKQGFDKVLVRAGLYTGDSDVYDLYLKLDALRDLQGDENFKLLMTAFKRMNNILEDYRRDAGTANLPESLRTELFSTKDEENLHKLASGLREELEKSLMYQKDYEPIFKMLADSKATVDSFFDHVMVMDENIEVRNNRLALLHSAIQPVRQLLDLNQLK